MKLMIVVPAHNEAENIRTVVEDICTHCPQHSYVVVNDGSTDDTADICRENGYNLLDLPINLGLAGAFQAGMLYALQQGCDAALQFDGDGQHRAECIPALTQRLVQGYDIVIGSRFVTVRKPINLRMAGSFLISFAMRFATGHKITDPTSGMRIFNRQMLEKFAHGLNYPPEPDTISYLLHCGARISEVQVQVDPRTAGDSYFTLLRSAKYMFTTAISILFVQWFRKNDLK